MIKPVTAVKMIVVMSVWAGPAGSHAPRSTNAPTTVVVLRHPVDPDNRNVNRIATV